MKKKLLVLGASGLTGYKITKKAITNYEVYGTFNSRSVNIENCNLFKLNLENEDEIKKKLI